MTDAERDRRSGVQWLRSVRSYLEFRGGESWRRLSDPEQRWHPERLVYLDGIRAITTILAGGLPFPENLNIKTKLAPVTQIAARRRA